MGELLCKVVREIMGVFFCEFLKVSVGVPEVFPRRIPEGISARIRGEFLDRIPG